MFKSPKSSIVSAKRQTTILLILAITLLVSGSGGIYALQSKQTAADQVVDKKQGEVGTNEEISRRYQSTLDAYNSTVEELRYVEPSVTKQSYVPTLVQQLQRMATNDHLKLTSVRPGTIVDTAPAPAAASTSNASANSDNGKDKKQAAAAYQTLSVSLSVEGTYKQIMTFVYHMTKFPKIVTVQSLNFSPRGSAPGGLASKTPLLGAEIVLQAYLFDDVAAPAPQIVSSDAMQSLPIVAAARNVANLTRPDGRSSNVVDPSGVSQRSIRGGFGSEQNSVR
ncbi:MAG: type 4a pilus biogenesis protein PilO [Capsulimonadaceae bacterium]|nr:type 4a pilus biogenesis protein PilO [Capsulimonadaceae bacterium]